MLGKVVNPDTGAELPPGEEGEICLAGPQVMLGYMHDEEATARVLRKDAEGTIWLHTGDMGRMDAEGFLYFRGRYKRVIKVSGMSVYPEQVDQVRESQPLVARCCVIGVPDSYQMTRVKAFVVLRHDSAEAAAAKAQPEETTAALRTWCKERLIPWCVPKTIEYRDSLPTTKVGKVAYTELT
jgi:long-chain acyl-CoA synthetase